MRTSFFFALPSLVAITFALVPLGCSSAEAADATADQSFTASGEEKPWCGAIGMTCADDHFCGYVPTQRCGGAGQAPSVCLPRPSACNKDIDPVCGCDGKTYDNACTASAAGVSLLSTGACPGAEPTRAQCNYFDKTGFVVKCGSEWKGISNFASTSDDPACAPYYSLDGERFESIEKAVVAKGCDGACIYTPLTSVMFVYCGHRMDYTTLTARQNPSCPRVYQYPDGIYDDPAKWREAHPCP